MTPVSNETGRRDRLSRLGLLEETLGYVDGLNLYEYVQSNPVGLVDPYGEQATKPTTQPGEGSIPLQVHPWGNNPPKEVRGPAERAGLTWRDHWKFDTKKKEQEGKDCVVLVYNETSARIGYWWKDDAAKRHEEVHVTYWRQSWGDLIRKADQYILPPVVMSRNKAQKVHSALVLYSKTYLAQAQYRNAEFDWMANESRKVGGPYYREMQRAKKDFDEYLPRAQEAEREANQLP